MTSDIAAGRGKKIKQNRKDAFRLRTAFPCQIIFKWATLFRKDISDFLLKGGILSRRRGPVIKCLLEVSSDNPCATTSEDAAWLVPKAGWFQTGHHND